MDRYGFKKQEGHYFMKRLDPGDPVSDSPHLFIMNAQEFKEKEERFPNGKLLMCNMMPITFSKMAMFWNGILGTMQILSYKDEEIIRTTFGLYEEKDTLVLIAGDGVLDPFLLRLLGMPMEQPSLSLFLFNLFELLVEEDVAFLQGQEELLEEMEEDLLRRIPNHFYEEVIAFRKRLTTYHAYYEQLINVGDFMQTNSVDSAKANETAAWQIYAHHVERLHNHVEKLEEYLVQIRELYHSLIDVSQNRVMSILTVVTTIFLPLTLIVGWYGMNFTNMPELNWVYGYPVIILISIATIVLEIVYFKKKKIL